MSWKRAAAWIPTPTPLFVGNAALVLLESPSSLVLRQKSRPVSNEFRWEDLGFNFELTDLEAVD